MLVPAIRMKKYWIFIHGLFLLATRDEETSEEGQEDESQDIWEQQQMRKAVKITEVIILYTMYISFLWLL